ncbi:hypothetical protein [Actinokineospora inagensis]|uniref:hypothetical protein n=1 Tax=Actinokineospora inagensis TaxID=103730 RepID=UPI000405553E|nr:hypothetical protein [Actinokineospora inagensis]
MARRLVAVTAAAVVLGLAGCGSGSDSSSPSSGAAPSSSTTAADSSSAAPPASSGAVVTTPAATPPARADVTAWAEKVCAAAAPDITALGQGPQIDPSDMTKVKAGMVDYLAKVVTATGKLADKLGSLGTPPVPNGQEVVTRARAGLDQAKTSVQNARAQLDKVSVADPAAFQGAFTNITQELQKVPQLGDPLSVLRGANGDLDAALDAAPSCKSLGQSGSGQVVPTA